MKITTVIDPCCEEEILIRIRHACDLPERIAALTQEWEAPLLGYTEGRIVPLSPSRIVCITTENGKLLALTDRERLLLKRRLYEVEAALGDAFVRINQSCLIRIDAIECFETTLGGTLRVRMKNGFCDYVSRRQLKAVKERMGIGT